MTRSTAAAKSSQTANGDGLIEVSSPARYFPVHALRVKREVGLQGTVVVRMRPASLISRRFN